MVLVMTWTPTQQNRSKQTRRPDGRCSRCWEGDYGSRMGPDIHSHVPLECYYVFKQAGEMKQVKLAQRGRLPLVQEIFCKRLI